MSVSYGQFVADKVRFDSRVGHDIDPDAINPILLPHQRDIVVWAVAGGRRAIFASFGLGKSMMQLEILRLTLAERGGIGLIVCPLGVRQEFVRDAAMLGLTVTFVRRDSDIDAAAIERGDIFLTNYEAVRDGRITPARFTAVSLDEASVLRSFGSKTYQTFLPLFDEVPITLNSTQSQRAQQMHVCPLQFDIADRLICRFSNPGDLVFDPFGGLMTVPVRALKHGRRGRSVELNPGYYLDGVKYLQAEERKRDMPSLFDVDDSAVSA